MIKLALAIGFLSVFGLVGYAIFVKLTKSTENNKVKQKDKK
jgi:hypothetical protein